MNFIGIGWLLLIIAGVILLILNRFSGFEIPEIIKQIHLIRVGIGLLLVDFFESDEEIMNDDGEEKVVNDSMDN